MNNLVNKLGGAYEYLLLCDSDSYFYDPDTLERALRYFHDPTVAVVQFRNTWAAPQQRTGCTW